MPIFAHISNLPGGNKKQEIREKLRPRGWKFEKDGRTGNGGWWVEDQGGWSLNEGEWLLMWLVLVVVVVVVVALTF